MSFKLWFVVIVLAAPTAVIFAIGKVAGPTWLKKLLNFYTWFFRGTPLLLQLFFIYFALPSLNVNLTQFGAAALAFFLNATAYQTEIMRAGIESIAKGQYEASRALGFTYWQTMFRIVLPQIIRRVLPATANEIIIIFKDTAILAAVAMGDLLRSAKEIMSQTFKVTPLFVALCFYLIVVGILVIIFSRIEKKYSVYE